MNADRGKDGLLNKLRLTPDDLVPGRTFTTIRKGHTEEMIAFEGIGRGRDRRGRERLEAKFVNLETGKAVVAGYDRFINGRVGMSRVIDAAPLPDMHESPASLITTQSGLPLPELGTDMIVVVPKDGVGQEVFTVVSKVEGDDTILSLPERRDRQLLRIPRDDLLRGESDGVYLRPVDPKFSLLKDVPEPEALLPREKVQDESAEEPKIYSDGPAHSLDVRAGEIIGDLLPPRTLEERLRNPEAVFLEAIDIAAKRMLEMGRNDFSRKALAMLMALKGGNLAHLPLSKQGW